MEPLVITKSCEGLNGWGVVRGLRDRTGRGWWRGRVGREGRDVVRSHRGAGDDRGMEEQSTYQPCDIARLIFSSSGKGCVLEAGTHEEESRIGER